MRFARTTLTLLSLAVLSVASTAAGELAKRFPVSDFGAKGDGKTDDIDAIAATHAVANQNDLLVKANEGASYYIGRKERTAVIRTNTDFGTASFIIDDTEVQNYNASVFFRKKSTECGYSAWLKLSATHL